MRRNITRAALAATVAIAITAAAVDVHAHPADTDATLAAPPPVTATATTGPGGGRSVVPFDYAWRFHWGHGPDGAPGPGNCAYEADIAGKVCTNMEHSPNRFAANDCATACCYEPTCMAWQWYGRTCLWGGANTTCSAGKDPSTNGGMRTAFQPVKTDYAFAAQGFDDSSWEVVDAPHDAVMVAQNAFNANADEKHGHMPRNVSWYRKHFNLPSAWATGTTVHIHFEGVFHYTQLWLNGHVLPQSHSAGYTAFTVRLDNATGVMYGAGAATENVLAVRSDATYGSGHWYEGGGIQREVFLVAQDMLHIVHDGVFMEPQVSPPASSPRVDSSVASAEIENFGQASAMASVRFGLYDDSSGSPVLIASNTTMMVGVPPSGTSSDTTTVLVNCTLEYTVPAAGQLASDVSADPATSMPPAITLWSTKTPQTYRLEAELRMSSIGDDELEAAPTVTDALNVTVGFRNTLWTADDGFALNGGRMHLRGFSNHNSFAGVGVALPPRIDLFRIQTSRAMGGNVWRMSHNPYAPPLYDLLDALGVAVWDENRDYGPWFVQEMHDMVKRDRNHASIIVWGFCNEFECMQNDPDATGLPFRRATLSLDATRFTAANNNSPQGQHTAGIDVQGFSHQKNASFESFHAANPDIPTVLSECCSCTSQRVGDRQLPSCIRDQNSPSLLPYNSGTLGVWTSHDYYGEPPGDWPAVSSAFGQIDLAGFPKPHAFWYYTNWLALKDDDHTPPVAAGLHTARVTDLLDMVSASADADGSGLTLNGITSAATAEMFADGKSLGVQSPSQPGAPISWQLPSHSSSSSSAATNCSASPQSVFPTNLTGVQCKGLTKVGSATTVKQCAKACCSDPTCAVWQFEAASKQGAGCWTGDVSIPSCYDTPNPVWVGGGRALPPPVANATLVARDGSGDVVATHTVLAPTSGGATALKASVDAPSPSTGTGTHVLLDGHDAALVSVSLVDASVAGHDALVSTTPVNVTFTIESGPGRIIGFGNGDPNCHVNGAVVNDAVVPTYGGLARVVVQANIDCATPNVGATVGIDADAGKRTAIGTMAQCAAAAQPIVVKATATIEGLNGGQDVSATASVPTSTDASMHSPLAAAHANVHLDAFPFFDEFVG